MTTIDEADVTSPAATTGPADADREDVARAAARDVARLLDRRGLQEVVALARRVLGESALLSAAGDPRTESVGDPICTLRHHEPSTRRGAAGRAVDDDPAR